MILILLFYSINDIGRRIMRMGVRYGAKGIGSLKE